MTPAPDLDVLLAERYPPIDRLITERPQPSVPAARVLLAERYQRSTT